LKTIFIGRIGLDISWRLRDKSRAGSKKKGRKPSCQNTYMLTTLISNYYFRELGIERNAGYKRKFGFEEENIYRANVAVSARFRVCSGGGRMLRDSSS